MKELKLWQKMGLVAVIVGGLTLGGLTSKYDSKGLESKLPTISMSVAEAKEYKAEGYEVPDLTGRTPKNTSYKEDEGLTYKGEIFLNVNGQSVIRLSRNDKIFSYIIDKENDGTLDYVIVDSDGDGIFESKYGPKEKVRIPSWVG